MPATQVLKFCNAKVTNEICKISAININGHDTSETISQPHGRSCIGFNKKNTKNSFPYNFISKNTTQYKNGLVVSLMSTGYNIKMLKN